MEEYQKSVSDELKAIVDGGTEFFNSHSTDGIGEQLVENANDSMWKRLDAKIPIGTTLTGCKADGVTDDSANLQTLINYCQTNHLELYLPPGTYKLNTGIIVDGKISALTGLRAGTTLDFSGLASGLVAITIGKTVQVQDFVMSGFTIKGNVNVTAFAMNPTGASGTPVVDSAFRDMRVDTFSVGLQSIYIWCDIFENIRFINCTTSLNLESQTNNCQFNRVSTTSTSIAINLSNCLGLEFNSCDIENSTSKSLSTFQSTATFINLYGENDATYYVGANSEAVGGESVIQFIGGKVDPSKLVVYSLAKVSMIGKTGGLKVLTAPTGGDIRYTEVMVDRVKTVTLLVNAYVNNSTTNQTITYSIPFGYTPTIVGNTSGLTVSTDKNTLTITAPNNTVIHNGIIEVRGF